MEIKFKSVKEFVNWLIDNEGLTIADEWGRQWKYKKINFWFKDIGDNDVFIDGLFCVHLYGTDLHII